MSALSQIQEILTRHEVITNICLPSPAQQQSSSFYRDTIPVNGLSQPLHLSQAFN